MLLTVIGWSWCLAVGFGLQRRLLDPSRVTHALFIVTFWLTEPILVFFAYTTVRIDLDLLAAGVIVVMTSWLVLALGAGLGSLTSRNPVHRGAIALGVGFGNTASVGYPLAILAFGPAGLALAVLYSQFQFLIPGIAVSRGVARRFAGPHARAEAARGTWALMRGWIINPPVAAGVLALALRYSGVDLTDMVDPVGPAAGLAVGLFGFFQLGLAMPLGPIAPTIDEIGRAAGTLCLRFAAGPLLLTLLAWLAGVQMPSVFLLLAGTPVAFNTIVLGRVYDLDTALLRLVVVTSTPLFISAVLVGRALN